MGFFQGGKALCCNLNRMLENTFLVPGDVGQQQSVVSLPA